MSNQIEKKISNAMSVIGVFLFGVGFLTGLFLESTRTIIDDVSVSNQGGLNIVLSPPQTDPLAIPPKPKLDSIALVRNGVVLQRLSKSIGYANKNFVFGDPSQDQYIVGDWNGDGVDTLGVYRRSQGLFIYTNSYSNLAATQSFAFGPTNNNHIAIVGDWDGNGRDGVGIYNPLTGDFFLRNELTTGNADFTLRVGSSPSGKYPIAGDWNGNGRDSVGFYDAGTGRVVLKNTLVTGAADLSYDVVSYGGTLLNKNTVKIVVGDWANQGFDTPAVYDTASASFFLRYTHNAPFLIYRFFYGRSDLDSNSQVLSGSWAQIIY